MCTAIKKVVKTGEISASQEENLSEIEQQYCEDLATRITQNPTKTFSLQKDKIMFYNLINRPVLALNLLETMEGTISKEEEWMAHWQ